MIDEKKLPFYIRLNLEKYLAAKNQNLCYESSLRRDFEDMLQTAFSGGNITREEYDYIRDTYLGD